MGSCSMRVRSSVWLNVWVSVFRTGVTSATVTVVAVPAGASVISTVEDVAVWTVTVPSNRAMPGDSASSR
jgi:hypothetical protein